MSQPDDTPKINISLSGPFGEQKVQEVKTDTNRQTPQSQFRKGWGATLSLPPSPVDALLQSCCFLGLGAFPISVLASLPPGIDWRVATAIYLSYGLVVSVLVYTAVLASLDNPLVKPAVIFRGFLLLLGMSLGGLLL